MGLFDKKYCSICGQKIGLLGNRKLEDGNLCKDCAAKLSPWFENRKSGTVEEISRQLAYREENKEALSKFNVTRSFGKYMRVYMDETAGKFFVTSYDDIAKANPDVVDMGAITDIEIRVSESRSEQKKDVKNAEGKTERVSYKPQRYTYSYDFYVIIRVNAPYFDHMRVRLNNLSVKIDPYEGMSSSLQDRMIGATTRFGTFESLAMLTTLPEELRRIDTDYAMYRVMADEIQEALYMGRYRANETEVDVPGVAVGTAVKCPHCEANTRMTESGICEYCGQSLLE